MLFISPLLTMLLIPYMQTAFSSSSEIKSGAFVRQKTDEFYSQYVDRYSTAKGVNPCLLLPLSYLEFAKEETHLFQLLFVHDMDLKMAEAKDFYQEVGNEKRAQIFAETIGVEFERAKDIFLDLFLYAHGMAVLTAAGKLSLDRKDAETMVTRLLSALVKQVRPEWQFPG